MGDVEYVRSLLARAVAEKGPDYVDPNAGDGCVYYNDDLTPACIVGHVIEYWREDHGTEIPDTVLENRGLGVGSDLLNEIGWSRMAIHGLTAAQNMQDDGRTWGDALEAFVRAVEGRRIV